MALHPKLHDFKLSFSLLVYSVVQYIPIDMFSLNEELGWQEEECEENFRKTCFITMVDTAMNVTTNVCKKPMVKDCDIEGEPICRTEYQSECWSKQIPHEVGLPS